MHYGSVIWTEHRVNVAPWCSLAFLTDLGRVWAGHRELDAPTWGGSLGGLPLWLQSHLRRPLPRPSARARRAPGARWPPARPPGLRTPPRAPAASPRPCRRPSPPRRALLTVTPYLSAMPCSVSPARTRCSTWRSMTPAPSGARTLAVLPYERVLVRARLSDSSASSDSEPERERGGGEGAEGRGARGPPSRRESAGEESAMGPAEAARSRSSPRGRRLVRRRLFFLLTGAADGRFAGAAGWRPRRGAAGRAWRAPPPARPAFPGRTCKRKSETRSRSRRAEHRGSTLLAGAGQALRCEEAGRTNARGRGGYGGPILRRPRSRWSPAACPQVLESPAPTTAKHQSFALLPILIPQQAPAFSDLQALP